MHNSVILIGRLTADPVLKTTTTGKNVTAFSVAVDRNYTKPGEERQTDFINIVAWGSTADFICKYFTKGDMIALRGELQSRSYLDKQNKKRTAYEVIAREVSFCGGKKSKSDETDGDMPGGEFEEVGTDEDLPF